MTTPQKRSCRAWYGALVKFTPFLAPDSVALLDLRVAIRAGACPHCHDCSALVGHGYLRGNAAQGHGPETRALRFFCSNRHSNPGCGRTFPVYWNFIIPGSSLRTVQLWTLLLAVSKGTSSHAGWQSSGLAISLRCACGWLVKWSLLTAHLRTWLHRVVAPPGRASNIHDPMTLRHLAEAFPGASCPIAAFQDRSQTPITG